MLVSAYLQGAMLVSAYLQGAWLDQTHLQVADLSHADLEGADLTNADLEGADLSFASLTGANLENVRIWRAAARSASWGDTLVSILYTESMSHDVAGLKRMIAEKVADGKNHNDIMRVQSYAMEKVKKLERSEPTKEDEDLQDVWDDHADDSPSDKAYKKILAKNWQKMGCAAEGAPYVLRILLDRLTSLASPFAFDEESPHPPKLAEAFFDEKKFPARAGSPMPRGQSSKKSATALRRPRQSPISTRSLSCFRFGVARAGLRLPPNSAP